jgi:hypothetical protein
MFGIMPTKLDFHLIFRDDRLDSSYSRQHISYTRHMPEPVAD